MDRLEALKFFVRLVEKKGIASAGRDFGLSPATASNRLSDLETYYEAKLINRTTRSISLTDEGRLLFERARSLIDESENLKNQIRHGALRISGLIKISAPQDLGRNVLAPLLDDFLDLHPKLQIELRLEDNYLDLINEGIDLAVRLGRPRDSSLRSRILGPNYRIVCASPEYILSHGTPNHPKDLADHNCLIMHWGRVIDREWTFKINGRKSPITVSGNRASNNGYQVKTWCLQGYGLVFKSVWDVQSHLESGELVEVLKPYRYEQNSALQLLFPGGYAPSRRVRTLIDFLAVCFEKKPHVR